MIVHLSGTLLEATPLEAVVDVGGVGYAVAIPVTTAEKLPSPGKSVSLHTLAVYREDAQTLYGFHRREERDFFRLLTEKVSGIGPKLALAIMSGLSLASLRQAIATGDAATLAKCPGIGRKTAERLCLELKDKVGLPAAASPGVTTSGAGGGASAAGGDTRVSDAVAALVALGFKLEAADRAVRRVLDKADGGVTTEELVRAALR
ncbi:MAG: Holliday junction branch migration protein RuvA [Opitutales bacterium]|nr:Holliday junction branch migration protein RuvA [Opitutales bacterium]